MSDDEKNKQLAEYSGAAKVIAAPASSSYPRFDPPGSLTSGARLLIKSGLELKLILIN